MRRFAIFQSAIWFPLLLLPLLFLLHWSGISAPIERVAMTMVQYLQEPIIRTFGLSKNQQRRDTDTRTITADNTRTDREEKLDQELQNRIVENAHLQTLVTEANILEEERAFLNDRTLRAISARVTSRSSEGLSEAIVINRGKQHGLSIGLPVIVNNGILIGTIIRVEDISSIVLLTTSPASHINAVVQNEQRSPGIIQGAFNISLEMRYIPQTDTIAPRNNIITSGNTPLIPEGFIIGIIEENTHEPGALFQEAMVRPLFETSKLSIVSVILP